MAITSEFIGTLNPRTVLFENRSAKTYVLPKFPRGLIMVTTKWGPGSDVSYDLLDKDTGKVVVEKRIPATGNYWGMLASDTRKSFPNGILLRFNNDTPVLVTIIHQDFSLTPGTQ